jgi:hypothetical protein
MNLDFAAMQENIDACDAQIAASGAVLGMMDEAIGPDLTGFAITRDGYFVPVWTWVGSLPTAEEMKPAIRSVVQSVAADLIRLPVREMSGGASIPESLTADVDAAIASGAAQHHTISLPVREMVEPGRIMSDAESAEHIERLKSLPGLTRLATDGERNGRMTWVPGV